MGYSSSESNVHVSDSYVGRQFAKDEKKKRETSNE
jgi:hypothetical protein